MWAILWLQDSADINVLMYVIKWRSYRVYYLHFHMRTWAFRGRNNDSTLWCSLVAKGNLGFVGIFVSVGWSWALLPVFYLNNGYV